MKKPNLLFVFPDEFRQHAMGFRGNDPVITPNIDRLAQESLVLTDAVSNYPVCSPYRGMLMSGKYPISNGVIGNCNTNVTSYGVYLKQTEKCFSDVLSENGYEAGYVGKWHLDPPEEPYDYLEPAREGGIIWDAFTPPGKRRHGFNFWYSYGCCDQHFTPHYWTGNSKIESRIDVKNWSVSHEADVVIDYLQNKDGTYRDESKPFALFWAPNPPHMPFDEVPDEYVEMYSGKSRHELLVRENVDHKLQSTNMDKAINGVKNYFAAVTGVDRQLGRVLQCLEEKGLKDNTIVIFTSDHGEMMGSHNLMEKSVWYEESFLVPFLLRWPEKIKPGSDKLHLGAPDIMPTLLGMMGLEKYIPEGVEGENYSDILLNGAGNRPESSFYININVQDQKAGRRGVRTDRYTFVIERDRAGSEKRWLFDRDEDSYQMRNIEKEAPDIVSEMCSLLNQWLVKTRDAWSIEK